MSPAPWYKNGLHFECTQCGNCCTGAPGVVWLSEEEIEAIADYLGKSTGEVQLMHTRLFGQRLSLTEFANGDCTFFDPRNRKCTIYAVRPRQCASWPFWEENLDRARWEGVVREVCPGIGRGPLHSAAEVERLARETEEWYGEESTLGRDRQG